MSFITAKSKIIQKRQILGLDHLGGNSSKTTERSVSSVTDSDVVSLPCGENISMGYPVYVLNGVAYLCDGLHECYYFSNETKTSGSNIKLINEGIVTSPLTLDVNKSKIYLSSSGYLTQYNLKVKNTFFQELGIYENGFIRLKIKQGYYVT